MSRTLLSLLVPIAAILLSSGASLRAQLLPVDERTITLRLFGKDARPIAEKGGTVDVIDNPVVTPEESDRRNTFRSLVLPDRTLLLTEFPVEIVATLGAETMRLLLDADVDSIRFRAGAFVVPRLYEPLFRTASLIGGRIHGREIDHFRVASLDAPPTFTKIVIDTVRPFTIDGSSNGSGIRLPHRHPRPYARIPGPSRRLFMAVKGTHGTKSDPLREEVVRSDDSGATFSTLPTMHNTIGFLDRQAHGIFFASEKRGWGVSFDLKSKRKRSAIFATTDGGEWWGIDTMMTDSGIIAGAFIDEKRGWLAGIRVADRTPDTEQPATTRWLITLYRTTDGGATIVPVAMRDPAPYRLIAYENQIPSLTLTPLDDETVIVVTHPSTYDLITMTATGGTIETHHSFLYAAERIDDSVAYIARHSAALLGVGRGLRQEWFEGDTLLRTTDGGRSWRPVLALGGKVHRIAFKDASHGCVIGDGYLLLTESGGLHWRYLPMTGDHDPYHDQMYGSTLVDAFWIDRSRLRLLFTDGTHDIDIAGIPPIAPVGDDPDDPDDRDIR